MDTYFRGNSDELAFCKLVKAGGNHLVACTAAGLPLGNGRKLKLRPRELDPVLTQYRGLPAATRRPELKESENLQPPRRPVPQPPANGLIVRGYCTYLKSPADGQLDRARQFYYKENPDRWAAETQSDMLWLTEAEWRSLVPTEPSPGDKCDVASPIRQRFYSTIAIDYMEGSVNSLPLRDASLTTTVQRVTPDAITLRVDGYGRMGEPMNDRSLDTARSRGCEVRVLGFLRYNRRTERFERFDLVGIGRAWGNKMNYTRREIRLDEYPWTYGIACQLVTGDSPIDRIPPYNLLHYNSAGKYFAAE